MASFRQTCRPQLRVRLLPYGVQLLDGTRTVNLRFSFCSRMHPFQMPLLRSPYCLALFWHCSEFSYSSNFYSAIVWCTRHPSTDGTPKAGHSRVNIGDHNSLEWFFSCTLPSVRRLSVRRLRTTSRMQLISL